MLHARPRHLTPPSGRHRSKVETSSALALRQPAASIIDAGRRTSFDVTGACFLSERLRRLLADELS